MAKQGGAREGAGRKKKYIDPSSIAFVIEKDDKEKLKQKYTSEQLKKYFGEWLDFLLDR